MAETIRSGDARSAALGGPHGYRGPEFIRALTAAMIQKLRLHEDDLLVDLCCGGAPFALEILRQVPLRYQMIGVDVSEERIARMPVHSGIRCVQMDLATFCEMPVRYDKILMVDAIAHCADHARLFAGLFGRLSDGGALLLVESGDAWWPRARMFTACLRASGFRVECGARTLGVGGRVGLITAARPRPQ